jgi:hypothetical protein
MSSSESLMRTSKLRNASQRRRLTPILGSHVGLGVRRRDGYSKDPCLAEMLVVDMDDKRIESWHERANLQDGKETGDGDDDSEEEDDDDSTDGAAQGVSSDLTGVTGSPPERTSEVRERPNGLINLDLRNALHPVATGSAFHRTCLKGMRSSRRISP